MTRKQLEADRILEEVRTMLNDIATSASIMGQADFVGAPVARELANNLHAALLEYEIGLAELGRLTFPVKASQ